MQIAEELDCLVGMSLFGLREWLASLQTLVNLSFNGYFGRRAASEGMVDLASYHGGKMEDQAQFEEI